MAPPVFSRSQIDFQLRTSWGGGLEDRYLQWSGNSVTYSMANFYPTNAPYSESNAFTMTAAMKTAGRMSFETWDDVMNIALNELDGTQPSSAGANITMNWANTTSGGGTYARPTLGGFNGSYYPYTSEQIWLNRTWTSLNEDTDFNFGRYGLATMVHEIGHALGLSHPGTYNAGGGDDITFLTHAEFSRDNRQWTIMSYFGGYNPATQSWTQDGTDNNWLFPQTPMIYDIMAVQNMYGADYNTRAGTSVYGYNVTSDVAQRSYFNFNANSVPIFTIWDGGGVDTIDCSGWGGNQTISLVEGTFSSVRGMNSNIAIAYGCSIENAFGGSGIDTLYGNEFANQFRGNAGNDTIYGGGNTDAAFFSGNRSQYTITDFGSSIRVVGPDGTDTVVDVERLVFGDRSLRNHFLEYKGAWTPGAGSYNNPWMIGDFNGDNLVDALRFDLSIGVQVFRSNGNSFAFGGTWSGAGNYNNPWVIGDFNGDNRDDIMRYEASVGEQVFLSNGTAFTFAGLWTPAGDYGNGWLTGDFNGDGRSDLMRHHLAIGEQVLLSTGAGFGAIGTWTGAGDFGHGWKVGDFNGDSRDDILRHDNSVGAQVFLSNGGSFVYGGTWTGAGDYDNGWTVGDFNGDGRDDIARRHSSVGIEIFVSNGSSFLYSGVWTASDTYGNPILTGDFDGDGRSDVFRWGSSLGPEIFVA